jgi:hypothetical protein
MSGTKVFLEVGADTGETLRQTARLGRMARKVLPPGLHGRLKAFVDPETGSG